MHLAPSAFGQTAEARDTKKPGAQAPGFLSGVRTGLRIQANQHLTVIKTVSLRSNEILSEGPVSSHEGAR